MLKPFRLVRPATLTEATSELARLGEQAKVYAGGVELVLLMRHGLVEADHLVDIKHIPGLSNVRSDDGLVRIGATVTHHALERHPLIRQRLPLLAEAESHVGNIRVRSQGTLGGNLCFADPHADPGTVLLVHEASVRVARGTESWELPLASFLRGTYEVALEPDELLVEVLVPQLPAGWRWSFQRSERFYRPTLNVAAAVLMDGSRLAAVKLAAGCIGPRAIRLSDLETRLQGVPLEDASRIVQSWTELVDVLEPVGDLLGSAEYKVHLTRVLLSRALAEAAGASGEKHE